METLPPAESAVVGRVVAEHTGRPRPLLEILHARQAALGFLPDGAVPEGAVPGVSGTGLSDIALGAVGMLRQASQASAPPPAFPKSAGA